MNETQTDWMSLAEAASKEMDPVKLMKLIEQLTQALDAHETRKGAARAYGKYSN